nr:MAG TPA: hypothetical protein [Caudoviricetes sp.]
MKTLKFKIEGNCPLLMHDDKSANPFCEFSKQLKAISSKRKKTEDDLLEMARIEWTASLYHTEQAGYFIKAECFEATFLAAAKSKKLGTAFKQVVRIPDNPVFHFKHEKLSPSELFEMDCYKDFRTVKVQQSKILRCRPVFNNWYCKIELWYDETRIDEDELLHIVEYAGKFIGVCNYRPKFGRFVAEKMI